jgi:hypothetical protein
MSGIIVAAGEIMPILDDVKAVSLGGCFQNADAFRHNFLANAVTGDYRDLIPSGRHIFSCQPGQASEPVRHFMSDCTDNSDGSSDATKGLPHFAHAYCLIFCP